MQSRRDFTKIARRFNAGKGRKVPSPAGTADLTGGRGENGGGIISPQIQRRPQMGEPEGWPREGAKKRELKKSFRNLWGQAVPTPIGAGTACPGATRRNLLHTSQFLRCCDWPRRHSRAPAAVESGSSVSLFQPSLRDAKSPDTLPGVETPGYFREVPPGLPRHGELRNSK